MSLDRDRLDDWLGKGILALIFGMLVYAPLAFGCFRFNEFLIVQGLTVAAGGLWLVRLWLNPTQRLLWPPICWVVLLFIGYATIRYLTSEIEYPAREEFIKWLVYTLVFFIVVNNLNRQEVVNFLLYTLVFLAMAIAIYALYQFATDSMKIWGLPKNPLFAKRASGTYWCPNHLAGFLELALPVGLAFTIVGRISATFKVFLAYATLMSLAGIVVTISRGGWMATVCALALFGLLLIRRPAFRLPALFTLVVLLGGGAYYVKKDFLSQRRIQETFRSGKVEDIRFFLWKPAVQLWQEEIWFGQGLDAFDQHFARYRPVEVRYRPQRVHNDFLNTLCDLGLTGFLIVMGGLVAFFWGALACRRYANRGGDIGSGLSNRLAILLGGSVAVAALLFHGMVDFNFHIPANALWCVVIVALVSTLWRHATERFWIRPGIVGCLILSALLVPALWFLTAQLLIKVPEKALLEKANLNHADDGDLELLRRAFAVDPQDFETAYKIGELLRRRSFKGDEGYEKVALEAMRWLRLSMALNRYEPLQYSCYGMCLDWLGLHQQATTYFTPLRWLDPNGPHSAAYTGWHYFQLGDSREARKWLEFSIKVNPTIFALRYNDIIKEREALEAAAAAGK